MSLIDQIRLRALDEARRTDMAQHGLGFSRKPLDESTVTGVEQQLGLRLPSILRAVYRKVGNGGFGPGYGLLPLVPDGTKPDTETAVGLYETFCGSDPQQPTWEWPRHLLPFCEWGCAVRSCVDCSSSGGSVITFDPNALAPGAAMSSVFARTHASIDAWFQDWIAGVKIWDLMFEPDESRAIQLVNPFTRESAPLVPNKLRRHDETVTLYRPVGPEELALIEASGWREFPPRLPEQPIFYPVTNEAYASQIARDWNVKASGVGYVTRFAVRADFLSRYERQKVGGAIHTEYWIPAEDLPAFNEHIVGSIVVTAEFR